MNIGILAQIKQKKITGINRVTVGTLTELLKIDTENQYHYIGKADWLPVQLDTIDAIYSSNQEIPLNYLQLSHQLDIVHSHNRAFFLNRYMRCGKILTIHDMIPYKYPEWNGNNYDYFDGPMRRCAANADRIIAVSESTKRDIIECYGIQPEKISVIYSGLYPNKLFQEGDEGTAVSYLKDVKFLLSVSAISANKNQVGMIEAFLLFKERNKDSDIKLVIAGPVRQFQVIRQLMNRYHNAEKDVIFTGFVPDEQLVWLYRNAVAFLYVSFYEGFGIPVLEALSAGKAVITSNVSSMPEVGGSTVEYCDPHDVESIEQSMEKLVSDNSYRKTLENGAKDQASKFSYEKAARETLAIYKMFE